MRLLLILVDGFWSHLHAKLLYKDDPLMEGKTLILFIPVRMKPKVREIPFWAGSEMN
jgi:hypothetical protein